MSEKQDDPFAAFKAAQREAWATFLPHEYGTMIPAGQLVRFAGVTSGQTVLDVACGTGVVAVSAARLGAKAVGLDLTPTLLTRAKENAKIAEVEIAFSEGDVEALPYADNSFDVVLSQFGHMFAPRPKLALGEMLRVLKPGGRIAFSTWPPEHFVGRLFTLVSKNMPLPPDAAPPPAWGDTNVIRERFGDAATEVFFDRGVMSNPQLSPRHFRLQLELTIGPVTKATQLLAKDPDRLTAFRSELEGLIAEYHSANVVTQHYLMTRARKRAK